MSVYVLVPGAWLGGSCWQRVTQILRDQGHVVYPVTLTGLGEREHLGDAEVGLATHVEDVVNILDYEDLMDVVLVGHSYAGVVVGSVAHQRPERIRHLVYLAANLPHDGESIFDTWSERGRAMVEAEARSSGTGWRWPFSTDDIAVIGADLSETDRDWLRQMTVGHPLQTFRDPAHVSSSAAREIPRTFIHCTGDGSEVPDEVNTADGGWQVRSLAAGHWPMISQPVMLAEVLCEIDTLDAP